MKFLTVLAPFLFLLAGSAFAKDCRIPDPKPGEAIKVPDACKDTGRPKEQNLQAAKDTPGAVDLGSGTTLRIGGRVRGEMAVRR